MGKFHPPNHSAGDANTIGGYRAVHARPAAFEGADGASYSVETVVEESGDPKRPFGGYILFVRWNEGDPVAGGHLETPFLIYGPTAESVGSAVDSLLLSQARAQLDKLIAALPRIAEESPEETKTERPWYEAMNDPDEVDGSTDGDDNEKI